MNSTKSQNSFLSEKIEPLAQKLSKILEIDYFRNIIGQTQAYYLLIYIIGLILCEKNKTMTAIATRIKACFHDSLERLLLNMKLPLKKLSAFFKTKIKAYRKRRGWLILDDVVISKKHAKNIGYAGYAYSSNEKRVIFGIHVVVLLWTDGHLRVPVGFRLWRPKNKTKNYRTKMELAISLIIENIEFCESCEYIVFDSWYCSKRFLRILRQLRLSFVSRLPKNRNIVLNKQKMKVSCIQEGARAEAVLPDFGSVVICCLWKSERLNWYVSDDLGLSLEEVRTRYDSRWVIEELFRYTKQNLGLERCQCRKDKAVVNHTILVFLAFLAMELISKELELDWYKAQNELLYQFYGFDRKIPELRERRDFLELVM